MMPPQRTPRAQPQEAETPGAGGAEPPKVSGMTFSELVSFYHLQVGRVETSWFRVMYLHAAMVGLLVFFGEADQFYTFQRVIVFAFYTVNLAIFAISLHEAYDGLRQALADLVAFPQTGGAVDAWFRQRTLAFRKVLRTLFLIAVWLLMAMLLFQSVLSG